MICAWMQEVGFEWYISVTCARYPLFHTVTNMSSVLRLGMINSVILV